MYPYSEYLQDYMYRYNKMGDSGKFRDDFRVTGWGRVLRRFFLDEMPQIVSFFKGDLSIVGVRALSQQYLSIYPEDIRELRKKFKPGLIPPYYADLPKTFDEVLESEMKYLDKKLKYPFLTDFTYFFRSVFNIVFKHARSG